MGNPALVLLDEPSSGMDPHARRAMWDVISASMGDGRSVMLTTHSMEECEALCSRVGIMVTGALRCLGTPQHLKNRFGEGYQIEMRVTPGSDTMAAQYITRNFGAKVMEVHGCRIRARMRMHRETSLSKIFAEMEKHKESLGILNYSITQSSLEQVFMKIANEHNEFQRKKAEDPEDEIDPIGDGSL
jgi:ABC-type multidrug transport system ATPase subunit